MAAGLTPANGATVSKSTAIRMEFCGMTGLELNYFRLINPNGQIYTDVTLDSGEYWATLKPNIPLVDGVSYTVQADGRISDGGTVKAIAPGTWGFAIATPVTDYLYQEDFSNTSYSIPHVMKNQSECTANQPTGFGWDYVGKQAAEAGNLTLVADPAGTGRTPVLKIDFWEGNYAIDKTAPGYFPHQSGFQAGLPFSSGKTEVYYAFDIYYPDDWIHNSHMYQGCATFSSSFIANNNSSLFGDMKYIGTKVFGVNPTVDAIQLEQGCSLGFADFDGQITSYQYHSERHQFQTGWARTNVSMKRGVWQTIEVHVKDNSPNSSANGELHIWQDGKIILEDTTIRWNDTSGATQTWDQAMLIFYESFNSCSMAPKNQSLYLDNVILSDSRITG